jgi:hypothetical protein
MSDYRLPAGGLIRLRAEHRQTREKRHADRLKAVILLGSGWAAEQVAEALLIDPDTVRSYFKRYQKGGVRELLSMGYRGGAGWLSDEELIEGNVYRSARQWDPTRLFRGAGFGAAVISPLGPIGVDLGYGFDRVDGQGRPDPGWQLHFKLGNFF